MARGKETKMKQLILFLFFHRVTFILTLIGFSGSILYLVFGDTRFNVEIVLLIIFQAIYLIMWAFWEDEGEDSS